MLDTKNHHVTLYREQFKSFYKCEMCATHPNKVYEMYCKTCDLPICPQCTEHRHHRQQKIRIAYKEKREQNENILINIRSETLYKAYGLDFRLEKIVNSEIAIYQNEITPRQSEAMLTKSRKLKDLMDLFQGKVIVKYRLLLIYRVCQQEMNTNKHISKVLAYEHGYEKSENTPVQFLRFIKNTRLPQMQDNPKGLLTLSPAIKTEDLIELLSKIQLTETRKRKLRAEDELTLMPSIALQKSFTVKSVDSCSHISCVTPDRIWLSDSKYLNLTDTSTGNKLFSVNISCFQFSGIHTVNTAFELIYINKNYDINKLSSDMKTTVMFIKSENDWLPMCVYSSPSSGDLLVGMRSRFDRSAVGKVARYSKTGQISQFTQCSKVPETLFSNPIYITENNNGDVVVSDWDRCAVVVTSNEGIHRFSYTRPPPGLKPAGICTDALLHILVCDYHTDTVQMLDENGHFLSYLLIKQCSGIDGNRPRSLSYDVNTHRIWVGSQNKVSVYRYVDRHITLTRKFYYLLILMYD